MPRPASAPPPLALLAAPDTAIALHARKNRAGADKVAQVVRDAGGKALVVEGDLAKPDTARRLVEETTAAFDRLDVVVSNAGFADRRAIGTLDRAAWDESLSAMTSAFFELATAARPWLVKAGANGRLVGVSSFVAHAYARGLPMFPASAAAKAGVEAFARAMAVDLAPSGGTANCVAPGLIEKDADAHAAALARSHGGDEQARADRPLRQDGRSRRRDRLPVLARCRLRHGPDHPCEWRSDAVEFHRQRGPPGPHHES